VKILLMEDEARTAQYLRKGLIESGFAVDVMNSQTVESRRSDAEYDLLIRDVPPGLAFSDLLARVRGLVDPANLRIAGLELDLVRHRATRDGRRLDLTPKEFLLLSLFLRRRGEVLSRAFIADQVWDINFDSKTNFVDVHIRRLRSKVDDPFPTKLIHTVRGMGYVLEER